MMILIFLWKILLRYFPIEFSAFGKYQWKIKYFLKNLIIQASSFSPLSEPAESAEPVEMEKREEQQDKTENAVEGSVPIKENEQTKIDEVAEKEEEESIEEEVPLIERPEQVGIVEITWS